MSPPPLPAALPPNCAFAGVAANVATSNSVAARQMTFPEPIMISLLLACSFAEAQPTGHAPRG
jgi:hypothetical protein